MRDPAVAQALRVARPEGSQVDDVGLNTGHPREEGVPVYAPDPNEGAAGYLERLGD